MRQETGDRICETGDKRHETGDMISETGDKRHETGDMISETKDLRQETAVCYTCITLYKWQMQTNFSVAAC